MDRKFIWIKSKGICFYCEKRMDFGGAKQNESQKPDDFTVDHRQPVAKGGKDGKYNLAGCCMRCNTLKANLTEEEFRDNYKTRIGQRKQENYKRSDNGDEKK
jgi:5-methylcytosine-specific restriction endonuclease McrA